MKNKWGLMLVVGLALFPGVGFCQDGAEPVPLEDGRDYTITVGGMHRMYLFNHSALQRRNDFADDVPITFRDGDTDGNGWGLRAALSRGDGVAIAEFVRSDYTYRLDYPAGGGHEIKADRSDVDLMWAQQSKQTESAHWGWLLGYRYVGVNSRIRLSEGRSVYSKDGDVAWHLLQGGYFGNYDMFNAPYVSLSGSVRAFLGEASGLAREGTDTANDGTISETYDDEYSVSYGAGIQGAVTFHLLKNLHLTVDYRREWLYSFAATTTGTVVFPDNDDALFIENSHQLTLTADLLF